MLSDTGAAELNKSVALAMGWTKCDRHWAGALPPGQKSQDSCHCPCVTYLPDFCRDAHAIGWMLEWLDAQDLLTEVHGCFRGDMTCWASITAREDYLIRSKEFYGSTRGEALARAILAYVQGQKEAENG